MAEERRAPEDFYFNTADDEAVYDAKDSTSIDDSYLAHLSERMEKSSTQPPPAPGPAAAPIANAGQVGLPPSFAPSFLDDDGGNPLRVEPRPPPSVVPVPKNVTLPPELMNEASNGIMELPESDLEPVSAVSHTDGPPLPIAPPGPAQARPSYPPRPSQSPLPHGPSDLLRTVPPPPEEDGEPYDPELDPATYNAPTFIRPSLIDQDPVPVIEIVQGNEAGRSYRFEKNIVTIGRSLDNDVVLTDIAVSRRHTRLARQGNNVFVEDMGSGNGTVVNGIKTPRSPVTSSDRIELGNTVFRVVFPGQDSFPANAQSLGPQANPPPSPLHQKSTMYLNEGNQVLQQIGYQPQQAQSQAPMLGVPSAQVTLPPTHEATPHYQPMPPSSVQYEAQQMTVAPRSSPRSFKLAMAVLAMVMLLIGALAIVAAVIHVGNRSNASPQGAATTTEPVTSDQLFAAGGKAYVERRWGQAADAFERVLAIDPGNSKAQEYLDQARAEERNQGTLGAARQAISEKNYEAAITTLNSIPHSSVYSTDAITTRADAEDLYAKELVSQAKAISVEEPDSALALLDRSLKLSPTNIEARFLQQQLSKNTPVTPPEATPPAVAPTPPTAEPVKTQPVTTPTPVKRQNEPSTTPRKTAPVEPTPPRPPGGGGAGSSKALASVLQLYKSNNFAGAVSRADELAASAPTEDERQKARSLSRQISRFATAWQGARSSSDPRQKMSQLEQALSLDGQISGGHFAPQIRPVLREVYVSNAQRAWRAGQYATACQSALRALKLDPAATGASQVSERCQSKAREFYEQGDDLQRTDVNQAKSYWRKVLNMVPRNDPYYAKAYSALNNAGRRRLQDEDE
jgi:pSer/pThr/pTyr-binding forkhead associated (FHA) protein